MTAQAVSRPAPYNGLDLTRTAEPDPLGAIVLDNWFPTQQGIRVRGGRSKVADLGAEVTAFLTYETAAGDALFAATADSIFDITSRDAEASYTADVTGLTGGDWIGQQVGTAGGQFLVAVNGADAAREYDGSSWSTASLTFDPVGPATSDLSTVWLYRNRLFFVQKDTLTAWYGGAAAKSGTINSFSLAGVFQHGGSLLFGTTWSMDAGDGMDDKCVFVSDQGEVAIYEGSNPGDIADWNLVGRYEIGIPLGPLAHMRGGGDVLILTTSGGVSLSETIRSDQVAVLQRSVTARIEPLWKAEAQTRSGPWQIVRWGARSLGLVSMPGATSERMLAVNLTTGAWGSATNWGASAVTVFQDLGYGAIGNCVYALDEGGLDDDGSFTAKACFSFASTPDNLREKVVRLMQAVFRTGQSVNSVLGVASDFRPSFPADPVNAATPKPGAVLWGTAVWGVDVWPSSSALETGTEVTRWRPVRGSGQAIAPTVQVRSGSAAKLDVELIQVDMQVEVGGSVV